MSFRKAFLVAAREYVDHVRTNGWRVSRSWKNALARVPW